MTVDDQLQAILVEVKRQAEKANKEAWNRLGGEALFADFGWDYMDAQDAERRGAPLTEVIALYRAAIEAANNAE